MKFLESFWMKINAVDVMTAKNVPNVRAHFFPITIYILSKNELVIILKRNRESGTNAIWIGVLTSSTLGSVNSKTLAR